MYYYETKTGYPSV